MGTPSPPPQFQEARQGSLCNQAIMLITDGAVEDYKPVLEEYNQPHRKVTPPAVAEGRGPQECCPTATTGVAPRGQACPEFSGLAMGPSLSAHVPDGCPTITVALGPEGLVSEGSG